MTSPFNRPEVQQAYAMLLGLKGQPQMLAEFGILPSVQLMQLQDTPYLKYGIPCADHATTVAVAGETSYVVLQPGPNVALQVRQILFSVTLAAAQQAGVRLLTAANIATGGFTTSTVQLVDLASETVGILRSSKIITGTHAAGNLGNKIFDIRGAAATVVTVTLPDPGIILYGNDPTGVPGLAVVGETANENITVGFIAREWPLPG